MTMLWTPDADSKLLRLRAAGLPASEIGAKMGVSRNAVLGRAFRLGADPVVRSQRPPEEPRPPKTREPRAPRKPSDIPHWRRWQPTQEQADYIVRAYGEGVFWHEIERVVGVGRPAILAWARRTGIALPARNRYFTPAEDAYIADQYARYTDVRVIATVLKRSWGDVRQRILKLDLHRSASVFRALRRAPSYKALVGTMPDAELVALINSTRAEAVAKAREYNAQAAATYEAKCLADMDEQITAGRPRNRAIVECRKRGIRFEAIAQHIGVTRERIRQICGRAA